jgi:hypothetical protein
MGLSKRRKILRNIAYAMIYGSVAAVTILCFATVDLIIQAI